MKKAIVFLANGFEEMEALGTVDILRRGGIEVTTVSITANPVVTGAHNVPVIADTTLEKANLADADALVLPGGMPGAANLNDSEAVKEALLQQYRDSKIVAAICCSDGLRRTRLAERSQRDLLSWLRTETDRCQRYRRSSRSIRQRNNRKRSGTGHKLRSCPGSRHQK